MGDIGRSGEQLPYRGIKAGTLKRLAFLVKSGYI